MRTHCIIFAVVFVIVTAASGNATVTVLPPVQTPHYILSWPVARLASDGTRLIIDYCDRDPSYSQALGRLKEWNGASWKDVKTVTCSWPDVAVSGQYIIATGLFDVFGHSEYWSNIRNFPGWTGGTASNLVQRFAPRAAIGAGDGYIAFTQNNGAWVENTTCGGACWNLNGLWRVFDALDPKDVGPVSIAGDDSGVFVAFASSMHGCVNVWRMYPKTAGDWVGPCFHYKGHASSPEVTVSAGQPAVAFVEDGSSLVVGRWNGQQWMVLGTSTAPAGRTFGEFRIEGSGERLWLASELRDAPRQASVDWYENGTWTTAGDPLEGSGATSTFTDLAVYQGQPYLTVFDNNNTELKVVRLDANGGTSSTCSATATAVCLVNNRFKVSITFNGQVMQAKQYTPNTGLFYVSDPSNIEILLKMLDACSFNAKYWVYAGGTTDQNIAITVLDTNTGLTKTYNPPANKPFQTITDSSAFACP